MVGTRILVGGGVDDGAGVLVGGGDSMAGADVGASVDGEGVISSTSPLVGSAVGNGKVKTILFPGSALLFRIVIPAIIPPIAVPIIIDAKNTAIV